MPHAELPDQYREPFDRSFPIREKQHLELDTYLDRLLDGAEQRAQASFSPDYSGVEAYAESLTPFRRQFQDMLGLPPPNRTENPAPRFEQVGEDRHTVIYRTWVEVLDGVDVYGIYMRPRDLDGKAPLLVAQHGGSGCPEAVCDLDTRDNYHSFGPEAAKRGYAVWAPYLLMQVSYGGDPALEQDRRFLDRKARLVGTSVVGIEVHKIAHGLRSLFRARDEIDRNRVGMVGLSYGGYYTLYTMAADLQLRAGVCSGYFRVPQEPPRSVDPVKGADVRFFNLLNSFGLTQVAGLICPRPLMIQHGVEDSVIPIDGTRRGVPHARAHYEKLGIGDRFEYQEHAGAHEFDNGPIFDFFEAHLT